MKTNYQKKNSAFILTAFLLVLCSQGLFSQQVIKFKSGAVYEVKILSTSVDSVRYEMTSSPGIVFSASMDKIEKIWSTKADVAVAKPANDSVSLARSIHQYNGMATAGGITGLCGLMILGAGIAIDPGSGNNDLFAKSVEETGNKTLKTVVIIAGCAVTLTGIVLMATGLTRSQLYKDKLSHLSVDLKATQSCTGITVKYRF